MSIPIAIGTAKVSVDKMPQNFFGIVRNFYIASC